MAAISPKAVVLNPAGLAEDVRVGPFSFLGPDVTVGAGTVIHNNVTVTARTRIGAGCQLFPGCIVGCAPEGSNAADPPAGTCTIGDGNIIREHTIIEAGAAPAPAAGAPAATREQTGTVLGGNNLLMVGFQIGHDASLEGEGIFANYTRIEHHARIEKFVRTSAFTDIKPHSTVGAYTFTTAYVCVDRDAPPYAIIQGYPFRVRSVNTENLRRCGFQQKTIDALKEAFRMLFNGPVDFPSADRLCSVEQAFDDEHVKYLVDSLRRSSASRAGRYLQGRA
jgi:UDP-N-acetylglucosamine acyltransferase